MPIKVRGFGARLKPEDVEPGVFFTAFGYKWRGLCLAVESHDEPLCIVLDYVGDIGDDVPCPRLLTLSALRGWFAAVPSEELIIKPRTEKDAAPYLAPGSTDSEVSHGTLLILPSGEPAIAIRHRGSGYWSLSTGLSVASTTGAMRYPEWEIAVAGPAHCYTPLARFPEEEG
jgi:hypothetical protein